LPLRRREGISDTAQNQRRKDKKQSARRQDKARKYSVCRRKKTATWRNLWKLLPLGQATGV